jgi:hypothetical protein
MRVEGIGLLAAALLVAGGLAGGFALIGSPGHQRDLELDRRRVADLADIAGALQRRFHPSDGAAAALPKTLPHDLLVLYVQRPVETNDPADHQPYAYARESATRYRLCATFVGAIAEYGGFAEWPHPAGRHCFEFDTVHGAEPTAFAK